MTTVFTTSKLNVAPFTGAWIEIVQVVQTVKIGIVAPFTGAWIEIRLTGPRFRTVSVAPFTGAWIEMSIIIIACSTIMSLPSRERGLK